ncbi:hypothetical protein TBLA_0E04400 [Henningerozyma blattae CBS 6284]|uniref:Carbohydrate kinase FGGY C-terminal domain-containing protein n=1 Tax=Henningerozyma blattae (strain ATCC 34711 / CBS 6284 / DSM 70876 / NBRC 10599 / NRRL Y-10934 / UCD 77-7) TaxID=1071380 RepID=I2H542_HENB6|nr:hypothetical protein TBLA_0E04400 [Tetrapisispora blattae CBS 6284]CCH61494.1 hypothetical protein TBLA_0E04400 [Tetrapisispora blattae CBS 6284]
MSYYIGVDVGTGSARACLIDLNGDILSIKELAIDRQELKPGYITQSTNQIWNNICICIRNILQESNVDDISSKIKGIGFDATCSLVVLNSKTDQEVAVGPNFEDNDQNVILWMDHRALIETVEINSTDSKCLKYVGGQMSVEMEIPKIKWLKNNMNPAVYKDCKFLDLPDFLTYKATGNSIRSFCSAVCKQGLLPLGVEGSTKGWTEEFLLNIGLEDLMEDNFVKLGGPVKQDSQGKVSFSTAGEFIGYLSDKSSKIMGISSKCAVSSGIIDAYAGWIGTIAASTKEPIEQLNNFQDNLNGMICSSGRLAVVAGTSTCHISLTNKPIFVPGVWGPYRDVLGHNFWCAEGGQSCTGALLQHVLETHPAYKELCAISKQQDISVFEVLNNKIRELTHQRDLIDEVHLIKNLFFYGDFHGNRSPVADEAMRGNIIGLSMDSSLNDLCRMYLGACEFIAQQTRHIVDIMTKSGYNLHSLYMSGGQCRNELLMQLISNCVGLPVVIPKNIDTAVVFGSALMGACASELSKSHSDNTKKPDQILWDVMCKMTGQGIVVSPQDPSSQVCKLLTVKYQIYLDMIATQKRYRSMVNGL